jgi:regulator of sigma E protease
VIGIGLMIFIHELGHFLAAKKVGVRVEAFSLGFGPRIFRFTRGDTEYRLSIIPLGGYVKMAGENPDDEHTGAPDELTSRSASERMLIFSAGVVMNFIFAFITLPIVFAAGIPSVVPEVGEVNPGGPAWRAGLKPGDRILEINGNKVYEFTDIPLNIALGRKDGNDLLVERDGRTFAMVVVPEKNEQEGRYQIQVASPTRYVIAVDKDSPAAQAGLEKGDRIVSIDGMPIKTWWSADHGPLDRPLAIHAARMEEGEEVFHDFTLTPEIIVDEEHPLIGIQQRNNLVKAIRGDLSGVAQGLREGDFIERINGREIFRSDDLEAALSVDADGAITVDVERDGKPVQVVYGPEWRASFGKDLALVPNPQTNTVAIMTDGALIKLNDPDVKDGMRILEVNGKPTASFLDISAVVNDAPSSTFRLNIATHGENTVRTIEVKAEPRSVPYLGFSLLPAIAERKLPLFQAIKAGFHSAVYMIKTCYLTLSRIFTGDVAGKNLGGIITIGRASYTFAELGLARLFFFLAILSINLGFLNILPIPILDGGHLLFLLIEKIKGSPVNEKIMGYSQIVGLAFILALLIYVTYNDILRLFN